MYFVITCSNGFASCDEQYYVECREDEIDTVAEETLFNDYYYSYGEDEYYDEDEAEYAELTYHYEEITKEEYEEGMSTEVTAAVGALCSR